MKIRPWRSDPSPCAILKMRGNRLINRTIEQGRIRMRNQTVMTRRLGIWAAALLCCVGFAGALVVQVGAAATPAPAGAEAQADRILIDGLKQFGALERSAVVFRHTKHTIALEKMELSCQRCHLDGEKGTVLKFKRLKDTDKQATMEIYHAECIACHTEIAASGESSGPVTCGGCHATDRVTAKAVTTAQTTRWRPIDLDKSLHYRHVKTLEKKCESCHHAYDEAAKKLVYLKGQEGACLYCHQADTVENRISIRLAAHQACISCHRERAAAGKDAGPADCISCHDVEAQAGIRVVKDIPRMERNQPDAVFVKTVPADAVAPQLASTRMGMQQVAFDHKAHEQYNQSCKACHHAALNDCVSCHRSEGAKEGGQVKLAQAMHKAGSEASCIGCHQRQQAKPECAGCHLPRTANAKTDDQTCLACHRIPPPPKDGSAPTPAETAALARQWLDARPTVAPLRDPERIPETVTIGLLSEHFEPASLPHRKIINTLMDSIATNKLAGAFHADTTTLCQGCHHQSPPAEQPPQCGSCHDRRVAVKTTERPGLMAAYHQQCLGCHDRMGIAKPAAQDCAVCHKERPKG
jgi:hypothetical protein